MKRNRLFFKSFYAVLFFSLCLSATGCAKKDKEEALLDPEHPVSLTVWHYYNGQQQTSFEDKINEFNETVGAEKGIVITSFSQGSVGELIDQLLTSAKKEVGAEEMPDIFGAYADTAYELDKLDVVADLTPYFTEEEIEEYRSEYIEEGRFTNDTLKIFPVAKSTELLFLNKTDWDAFSQATNTDVSALSTMEGLVKTAQDYYNWSDGKAFFGRDSMANYFLIGGQQLGSEIFHVENSECKLQLDEAVFRKLWDNYYVPFVSGYFYSNGRFRSDDMKTNHLIAYIGSTSSASYFPSEVIKEDDSSYPIECLVLPAPIFASGEPYMVQQGAGMVVAKSTKQKEYAACEFLKWFTDTENNLSFSVESGYLPVKEKAMEEKTIADFTKKLSPTLDERVQQAVTVSMQELKKNTLYTNRPFESANDYRNVLETLLTEKAKEDRRAIESLIASGTTYEEAVAQFTTDDNFQSWFQNLKQAMQIK